MFIANVILAAAPKTPEEIVSDLIGNEWTGFTLDFTINGYALRKRVGAEGLLGSGPFSAENGLGLDFTDNTYAVRS